MELLEIISLLFALLILIKLIFVILYKTIWYKRVVLPIYKHPKISIFVFVILSLVIFYKIIKILSLVEIFSVMAFTSMIIGVGFMLNSKEFMEMATKNK